MKIIKSMWLEIIFACVLVFVMILSVTSSVHVIDTEQYKKHLQKSSIELGTASMDEYLAEIEKLSDCTAIIVVKNIENFHEPKMIDALKSMGFKNIDVLSDYTKYHSFIGIWSDGKVIYEEFGENEPITYGQKTGSHYIYAMSTTPSSGNAGYIYIDDVRYSVNYSGFNIVTIDNKNDALIDSVAYNTNEADIPLYRLENKKAVKIISTREESDIK